MKAFVADKLVNIDLNVLKFIFPYLSCLNDLTAMKSLPLWGIDLGGTKIEGVILRSLDDPHPILRMRIDTEGHLGYPDRKVDRSNESRFGFFSFNYRLRHTRCA
jgi:hypothetical protein